MSVMADHAREKPALGRWKTVLVTVLITAVALGLAAYAAAASYDSVSGFAAAHKVPLPRLNPAGLDGGLFGVIVLNIALTWAGQPLGWLRLTARLFAAGTVMANAAAGWPDPAGVGLRIAAPALFVILAEVASAVLLRRHRAEGGEEGIPLARWLLDFRGTARLWRRMKLWRIRDYREAVDMELSRLQAIEKLTVFYAGRDWQQAAPGDLAWMLRNGVRMTEALKRVAELTAPVQGAGQGAVSGVNSKTASGPAKGKGSARKVRAAVTRVPADVDTQAEALRILGEDPDISGGELGRRLGMSESYGCRLKKQLAKPAPVTGEQPRVS